MKKTVQYMKGTVHKEDCELHKGDCIKGTVYKGDYIKKTVYAGYILLKKLYMNSFHWPPSSTPKHK